MPPALSQAVPIPSGLKCPDAIVWVNLKSKTYHMPGDVYYGRTRQGAYMCQSDAEAKGYHMAGMPHRHTTSKSMGTPTAEPQPAST